MLAALYALVNILSAARFVFGLWGIAESVQSGKIIAYGAGSLGPYDLLQTIMPWVLAAGSHFGMKQLQTFVLNNLGKLGMPGKVAAGSIQAGEIVTLLALRESALAAKNKEQLTGLHTLAIAFVDEWFAVPDLDAVPVNDEPVDPEAHIKRK